MKRKTLQILSLLALTVSLCACGGKDETPSTETTTTENVSTETTTTEGTSSETEIVAEILPEGMYRSELTNELIDESLKNQRPVAIMVDNESIALPHYGLTQADVVYEMMNSTQNGRITRFMCLVKDWETIERFGSIRSTRPTNLMICPEWDAILIHDGGPVYINGYFEKPYVDHLSGGFSRIENGKAKEYTEYVSTGELASRIEKANIEREYTEHYEGAHYKFANESNPVNLSSANGSIVANDVILPFPHNDSELHYDAETQLYYYSEYGDPHLDPQNDNAQLCFKNVLLQSCPYLVYDENGYFGFYAVSTGNEGYYITNGHAIKVTWSKTSETSPTRYFDEDGNEITINTGKTYVGFVPDDDWKDLVIE